MLRYKKKKCNDMQIRRGMVISPPKLVLVNVFRPQN